MCSGGKAGARGVLSYLSSGANQKSPEQGQPNEGPGPSYCTAPQPLCAESRRASRLCQLWRLEVSESERDRPGTLQERLAGLLFFVVSPDCLTESTPCGCRCLQVTQVWRKSRVTVKSL